MEDLIIPVFVVSVLFWSLRQMEHWLHRHIFKVGWLVTKSYETTTILYYTFFLPGVFLNQVTIWLAAGVLDVRADRAVSYPEKQEIGELKLDFVKLSKKAPQIKITVINIVPLLVGLFVIWWVAHNVFDVRAVLEVMGNPVLGGLGRGFEMLLAVPDFWLWTYFLFTVANTMMPDIHLFRGWGKLWTGLSVGVMLIVLLGLGESVSATLIPLALEVLNALSLLFAVMIGIDLLATGFLALIENTIEWVTGDSATFKGGKMIAMRREDVIAQREQERQKEQKKREQERQQREQKALSAGPPSVYRLPLPLPGAPGAEPSTLIFTPPTPESLPGEQRRDEPSMLFASAEKIMVDDGGDDEPDDSGLIPIEDEVDGIEDEGVIYEDVDDLRGDTLDEYDPYESEYIDDYEDDYDDDAEEPLDDRL